MSKDELEIYMTQAGDVLKQKFTVEELLTRFNSLLKQRADELGVPVGDINIDGVVEGNESDKIAVIRNQFKGLLEKGHFKTSFVESIAL